MKPEIREQAEKAIRAANDTLTMIDLAEGGATVTDGDTYRSRRGALIKARTMHRKSVDKATELVQQDGTIASFGNYRDALRNAEAYASHAEQLRNLVKSEPRTYGKGASHSYWKDMALRALGGVDARAAEARLQRHAIEVRTDDPKRAEAVAREVFRSENWREERAVSTSTFSAAAPAFDVADWGAYWEPNDAFAQAARNLPLPPYGMSVSLPTFSSATQASAQTENSSIDISGPSGAAIVATVQTVTAGMDISQQLSDRGGSDDAGSFDSILQAQLQQAVRAKISQLVLSNVIATGGTVTDGTTLTTTRLWADLSTAVEQMADQAGTRYSGTHVFSTTDFARWAMKQVDTTNARPIFTPDAAAVELAAQSGRGTGYTGIIMPGGLRFHTDDSLLAIQAASSHPTYAQVVVAQMPEVFVYTGEPIAFSYVETDAADLSVFVGLRQYIAVTARFANAVQVISGAGLASLS